MIIHPDYMKIFTDDLEFCKSAVRYWTGRKDLERLKDAYRWAKTSERQIAEHNNQPLDTQIGKWRTEDNLDGLRRDLMNNSMRNMIEKHPPDLDGEIKQVEDDLEFCKRAVRYWTAGKDLGRLEDAYRWVTTSERRLDQYKKQLGDQQIEACMKKCKFDDLRLHEIKETLRETLRVHPWPWTDCGRTWRDADDDEVVSTFSSLLDYWIAEANPVVVLVLLAEIERLQEELQS